MWCLPSSSEKVKLVVLQMAGTGRKLRSDFMCCLTSPGGRHVGPVISITRWGVTLGAVRNSQKPQALRPIGRDAQEI